MSRYFLFLAKLKGKIRPFLEGPKRGTTLWDYPQEHLTWITHNVFMWICVSIFIYVCMSVGVCIFTYAYILVYFPLTYTFSCCCCCSFFPRLSFSLIFVLTWGTTKKIRRFCPFCAILAIVDAIHICLQYYFNFTFYILTFNQFVYLFVCFLFVCFIQVNI